ncbi:MAG TPA: hypothetical protein VFF03_16280 [Rhodocyclaceae bacterium]|nr:hypothetical protein [Rhodocyclaceae bacterium]
MNHNKGGIETNRILAEASTGEGESLWAVLLIALAIIGVMYIYDRIWAQPVPQRPAAEVTCNPPSAVVSDAATFKPRS